MSSLPAEHEPVQRAARSVGRKTYRASGIPSTHGIKATMELLQSIFELEGRGSVLVQSLAPNPYSELSQIATFMLTKYCSKLDGNHDRWSFTMPEDQVDWTLLQRKHEIIIDTHFLGFTPLSTPSAQYRHDVDIIAISGFGHAFGSFKERGGTHMWLRDALADDFPDARVLIYGYDSRLAGSLSFQSLDDIAARFTSALRSLRTPLYRDRTLRPTIFIAHSLGGLVLKQALVQMKHSQMRLDQWNLRSTYGILFFGVPSLGMDVTALRPMVEGQDNWAFLAHLVQNSVPLEKLHKEFCESFYFTDSPLITYYETQKSPTPKNIDGRWEMVGEPVILVNRTSATQRRSHDLYAVNPIPRNHSDLVKFGQYDHQYFHVKAQLKAFILSAVEVIQRRTVGFFAGIPKQPSDSRALPMYLPAPSPDSTYSPPQGTPQNSPQRVQMCLSNSNPSPLPNYALRQTASPSPSQSASPKPIISPQPRKSLFGNFSNLKLAPVPQKMEEHADLPDQKQYAPAARQSTGKKPVVVLVVQESTSESALLSTVPAPLPCDRADIFILVYFPGIYSMSEDAQKKVYRQAVMLYPREGHHNSVILYGLSGSLVSVLRELEADTVYIENELLDAEGKELLEGEWVGNVVIVVKDSELRQRVADQVGRILILDVWKVRSDWERRVLGRPEMMESGMVARVETMDASATDVLPQ